jgi:hypothetical protein
MQLSPALFFSSCVSWSSGAWEFTITLSPRTSRPVLRPVRNGLTMSASTTDYDTIAHLDFDIKDDKSIPCDSWTVRTDKGRGSYLRGKDSCDAAAEVVTTRSCCGAMEHLCKDCLNNSITDMDPKSVCKFCTVFLKHPKYSSVNKI